MELSLVCALVVALRDEFKETAEWPGEYEMLVVKQTAPGQAGSTRSRGSLSNFFSSSTRRRPR